jgi:hypothetical protein
MASRPNKRILILAQSFSDETKGIMSLATDDVVRYRLINLQGKFVSVTKHNSSVGYLFHEW